MPRGANGQDENGPCMQAARFAFVICSGRSSCQHADESTGAVGMRSSHPTHHRRRRHTHHTRSVHHSASQARCASLCSSLRLTCMRPTSSLRTCPCLSVSGQSCVPLSSTSACRAFFPAVSAEVAFPPVAACQVDIEEKYFGANTQAVWNILHTIQPASTVHNTQAAHTDACAMRPFQRARI